MSTPGSAAAAARRERPRSRAFVLALAALLAALVVGGAAGLGALAASRESAAPEQAMRAGVQTPAPTQPIAPDAALIRLQPSEPSLPQAEPAPDWAGLLARAALALLALPLLFWILRRPQAVNRISGPGFEVISPSERRRFMPLEERFQTLDFVSRIPTDGQLRLSANLNKVTLSVRKYGYLMEDKNYRNALLVNRRRVRRTLLRDGDVLDLGDLTLLYRDTRAAPIVRHSSITPAEGKAQVRFERLKGPVRKGMPMLVFEQQPNRVFYVTKNKVYIGRSEANDLVIKARNVYYRHAKLERIGGRWKLQDLSILGNTFVNNRRIEQRFLKEGDEISIESHRFKFAFVTRTMRERPLPAQAPSAAEGPDELAPEPMLADTGDGAEEADESPTP